MEKHPKASLRDKLLAKHEEHVEARAWRSRRKMGPQAVPRGFLGMYMLALITRAPETGYSIMQHINERTRGSWRPGPGTIYPLLKTMSREELIEPLGHGEREDSVSYSITGKGRAELEEMRKMWSKKGVEGQAMMRLVAEMFPASHYTSFFTSHFREELELFAEKVAELPEAERASTLKEVELILERELNSIKGRLAKEESA